MSKRNKFTTTTLQQQKTGLVGPTADSRRSRLPISHWTVSSRRHQEPGAT